MVDIHSHVLPGIDDGARSLAETRAMCAAAAEDGCDIIVATPHQRTEHWPNEDRQALRALHAEVAAAVGTAPTVLLGAEIRIDRDLLAEVERLPAGSIQPLAGTRHLLLELDSRSPGGVDAVELVHELTVAGWRPIFAHPEMIPWLVADGPLMERLVAKGARFQITAMSLTGDFGRGPKQCCAQLLDAGLVHFVASDCHDTVRRPPGLRRAYNAVVAAWGAALAHALFESNPRAVVDDRPVPASCA